MDERIRADVLEQLEQLLTPQVPSDITDPDKRESWVNGWGTCALLVMDIVKGRSETTRIQ